MLVVLTAWYPENMKRYIFFFLFLFVFALSWAQNTTETTQTESYIPYRIAVTDFSVNDLSGSLEDAQTIANALANAFEAALVESGRFNVVTRNNLDSVMAEIALSQSGVIKPEQAIELGKLSGAELLVTGNLVYNEDFQITIKFINALTGEIDAAASLQAQDSSGFIMMAQELCSQAGDAYAPRGTVIATGQRTFIDLGSESGVGDTRTGTLVRERLIEGYRFHDKVGSFSISSLGPEASTIIVNLEPNMQVQVGDIAMLDSHFDFDMKTVNMMPDIATSLGTAVITVRGDNIPQFINIYTAEGDIIATTTPSSPVELFQGAYVVSPYGADAYDHAPAVAFTIQAGGNEVIELDLSGHVLLEHTEYIQQVLYSPTGDLLLTGARDGKVIIRDATTGYGQRVLDLSADNVLMVNGLDISQDARYVATSLFVVGGDAQIDIWSLDSLELILSVPNISEVSALAFSPDATVLYVVDSWDDNFYQIAVPSGEVLLEQAIEHSEFVSFDGADGMFFGVSGNNIGMYSLVTGELLQEFTLANMTMISALTTHAAQGWVAVGGMQGLVHIYDFAGDLQMELDQGRSDVETLDFNLEGTRLATASGYEVYVWDLEKEVLEQSFTGHEHFISKVAFAPAGNVVAAASWDKAFHLWRLPE